MRLELGLGFGLNSPGGDHRGPRGASNAGEQLAHGLSLGFTPEINLFGSRTMDATALAILWSRIWQSEGRGLLLAGCGGWDPSQKIDPSHAEGA